MSLHIIPKYFSSARKGNNRPRVDRNIFVNGLIGLIVIVGVVWAALQFTKHSGRTPPPHVDVITPSNIKSEPVSREIVQTKSEKVDERERAFFSPIGPRKVRTISIKPDGTVGPSTKAIQNSTPKTKPFSGGSVEPKRVKTKVVRPDGSIVENK